MTMYTQNDAAWPGGRGRLKANKSKPGAGVETTESTKINLPASASGDWMCLLAGSRVLLSFFLAPLPQINYLKISIRLPFQPNGKRIFIKFHLSCTNDLFKFSLRLCRSSVCATWISRRLCVCECSCARDNTEVLKGDALVWLGELKRL